MRKPQDISFSSVDIQILWNRLLAIVEEQAQTLIRTSFSPTVREAGDLSAGVFDAHGRMIAQAVTGTPGHVNAMAASVKEFLKVFPTDELAPGDVLVTNDPWKGTGHLNDFTVVTPVFQNDSCVALFAATTHIADVGGLGFGADGRSVYEEGLNIPISRLFRKGRVDETLMRLIRANVRDPIVAEGDFYSLAACNDAGAKRLSALMSEWPLERLDNVADAIIDLSRAGMAQRIGVIGNGAYEHAMRIDGYDAPIDLVCTVTIGDDIIDIDFAGTSGTSARGVNVPLTYTQAYASFGARCVIGGDIPNNAGSLAAIRVSAPEGCILNAPPPSAVSARHAVGQMLPDVVLGCLAKAGVETPAEGASCIFNPVLMSVEHAVEDRFVINPIFNGGTGARQGKDGLSTTAFPSGVRTTSTEINEAEAPLIFWRREFRQGSAGRGEYRGGLGQSIEIAHASGQPFAISKMFDRTGHPPRGRDGGEAGAPATIRLKDGPPLNGMGRETVPAGSRLIIETPGGGGLGPPAARDAARVAEDDRNELI
ncbi:MAG: hydantoinase B/oxoprolinase family protein [Pseudomonadota bacterium]